ncbi:MAG: hypothetical protein V5A30_00360 [Haloarculaceae archaeon]
MQVTPRLVGLVALAALVPAAAFVVVRAEWLAAVTLVNVVLIAGSLAVALSPHDEEHPEDPDGV